MYALTFHGKFQLVYERVPDPAIISPNDVIVKVSHTAICGSDLHVYRALEQGLDAGTIMGHEFVGEIVEVGRNVQNWRKGQFVVSPFTTNCGVCYFCRIGLTCRCTHGQLYGWVENGHGLHGAQAEFVRVPMADSTLTGIPEGVKKEDALMAGDILATGTFCAEGLDIREKRFYAVVGCGPVGLMCIQAAKKMGAKNIVAFDRVPERLALANKLGATPLTIDDLHVKERVLSLTEGRGFDGVMEAVGHPSASRLAYEIIRPGGTISTVGVHTSEHFSFSPVDAYNKNITYKIGRAPARYYMEKLLSELQQGCYDIQSIISHRMSLEEGVKGYEIFDRKKENVLKIILENKG